MMMMSILNTRQHTWKLDLFLFSGEGAEEETPTLLSLLERANLNHWTTHVRIESWSRSHNTTDG
jgi:hypothetical protein